MVSFSVLPASYRGCTVSKHTHQSWLHHMLTMWSAQQAGGRHHGLALHRLQEQCGAKGLPNVLQSMAWRGTGCAYVKILQATGLLAAWCCPAGLPERA